MPGELFKGGQGRSAADVQGSAWCGGLALAGAAIVAVLAALGVFG